MWLSRNYAYSSDWSESLVTSEFLEQLFDIKKCWDFRFICVYPENFEKHVKGRNFPRLLSLIDFAKNFLWLQINILFNDNKKINQFFWWYKKITIDIKGNYYKESLDFLYNIFFPELEEVGFRLIWTNWIIAKTMPDNYYKQNFDLINWLKPIKHSDLQRVAIYYLSTLAYNWDLKCLSDFHKVILKKISKKLRKLEETWKYDRNVEILIDFIDAILSWSQGFFSRFINLSRRDISDELLKPSNTNITNKPSIDNTDTVFDANEIYKTSFMKGRQQDIVNVLSSWYKELFSKYTEWNVLVNEDWTISSNIVFKMDVIGNLTLWWNLRYIVEYIISWDFKNNFYVVNLSLLEFKSFLIELKNILDRITKNNLSRKQDDEETVSFLLANIKKFNTKWKRDSLKWALKAKSKMWTKLYVNVIKWLAIYDPEMKKIYQMFMMKFIKNRTSKDLLQKLTKLNLDELWPNLNDQFKKLLISWFHDIFTVQNPKSFGMVFKNIQLMFFDKDWVKKDEFNRLFRWFESFLFWESDDYQIGKYTFLNSSFVFDIFTNIIWTFVEHRKNIRKTILSDIYWVLRWDFDEYIKTLNTFEKAKINSFLITTLENDFSLINPKTKENILDIFEEKLSISKSKIELVVNYLLEKNELFEIFITELDWWDNSIRDFAKLIKSTRNIDIHNCDWYTVFDVCNMSWRSDIAKKLSLIKRQILELEPKLL